MNKKISDADYSFYNGLRVLNGGLSAFLGLLSTSIENSYIKFADIFTAALNAGMCLYWDGKMKKVLAEQNSLENIACEESNKIQPR